jgi:hypothetical protein
MSHAIYSALLVKNEHCPNVERSVKRQNLDSVNHRIAKLNVWMYTLTLFSPEL